MNDQYGGPNAWEEFLAKLEISEPRVCAIGVTDYYTLRSYERVLQAKRDGRLPDVELVFPNIEMRYGVGTAKSSPINVHLLVSPDDPQHIEKTERFLRSLSFHAYDETFQCVPEDLVRLGKAHDPSVIDESVALAIGVNQFKVNPDELRAAWDDNEWVKDNVLIALAGRSPDGTSGLQGDASLAAQRKTLEKFAHIVFSSNPGDREFWLGRGAASIETLQLVWGGPKPALHGSDAHSVQGVATPDLERLCWIRGSPVFESLRQACLEPEDRAFIGEAPPNGASESQTIAQVDTTHAKWLKTPNVPLNPGLVAIVGPRGSGKTALADLIAAGSSALSGRLSDRSFISRARELFADDAVELTWADGKSTTRRLRDAGVDEFDTPQVQYLSQQFVDTLCSAEGLTDELLSEIERVIFSAHPSDERMGALDFKELLDLRAERGRAARYRSEVALAETLDHLETERQKLATLPDLRKRATQQKGVIAADKKDRAALSPKGNEERSEALRQVVAAAEAMRARVDRAARRHLSLVALKDEVMANRGSRHLRVRSLEERFADALLTPEQWAAFSTDYAGDVESILDREIASARTVAAALTGPEVDSSMSADPAKSLVPVGVSLEGFPLRILEAEVTRLRGLVGMDAEKQKAFERLTEKISREEGALAKLQREIDSASQADARIADLTAQRALSYIAVFDGVAEEEHELVGLYEPLRARLGREEGALGKLSFAVRRSVDIETWAKQGENLLDLRTTGPFRGHGALLNAAREELLDAWESGTSQQVSDAMTSFIGKYNKALLDHAPVPRANPTAFRDWAGQVARWLYGTAHIAMKYGVQYEGVDIERLSPGTRGIVLLLLYLAIDSDDDRPLVIDQPEENLDPKSVFDELVPRFREARRRRQIVIVTHNANLVVNADADQVIVATAESRRPGDLPDISYVSGGLEDPEIRRQVCEILEGGEEAFRQRARRLRVRIRS